MSSKDYDFKKVGDGQPVGATVHWETSGSKESRPIALLFHGGAFVVGTRFTLPQNHIDDLLAEGFVVVTADYSLCPQVSLYDGAVKDARDAYLWCKNALPGLLADEGITVDPSKIVAVGYSAGATLSLLLGAEKDPPAAIVDFYGAKCYQDSFWTSPLASMSKFPDFDEAFINKVYDEPLQTSTASSLERGAAARTSGPPKPDLSKPRNAWLFHILKTGTHLKVLCPDGNVDRIDPINGFSKDFPPTFFLHGDADDWVLPKFSEQAHQQLKDLGVETRIEILPGLAHGFDAVLAPDDERYESVKRAFQFAKKHVTAS